MHASAFFLAVFATAASVHAAPAAATAKNIQCVPGAGLYNNQTLSAGDYFYGSGYSGSAHTLGYKEVTEKSGAKALWVVNANDAGAKPFHITQRAVCNATSLGYVSNAAVFNAPTPVKLITDVFVDREPQCVGLNSHYTSAPASGASKTHIVLTKCEQADDAYAQSNQFWSLTYKYNTLFPLVGPWPVPHKSPADPPTWPIYPPASGAEPQAYRAGPSSGTQSPEQTYVSFN